MKKSEQNPYEPTISLKGPIRREEFLSVYSVFSIRYCAPYSMGGLFGECFKIFGGVFSDVFESS